MQMDQTTRWALMLGIGTFFLGIPFSLMLLFIFQLSSRVSIFVGIGIAAFLSGILPPLWGRLRYKK